MLKSLNNACAWPALVLILIASAVLLRVGNYQLGAAMALWAVGQLMIMYSEDQLSRRQACLALQRLAAILLVTFICLASSGLVLWLLGRGTIGQADPIQTLVRLGLPVVVIALTVSTLWELLIDLIEPNRSD